ncbi:MULTISPECIES: TonB-dependent receptor domain-containing protein [unclassified Proteus (in: enterobacteria)]|uniref:TonB-dependent receptor domain-containing protein n=1 Tax=unclassified Proteus (in: enterobacteria) TaxID=257482 RepID=UPI001377079F|nr:MULTISPECIES: TonB-dependent receptor [unclassified Proteus (in: enterobacteria)]NBL76641.1 TonB-dependent receptor [Proteus sp. G2672]NBL90170.1 TonB-dependent receptor [Proteus sp. G2673]NBM57057.1 TonB-dependent receptor [Proteus sp. G2667]NBM91458.1 TonB-dependent receptor [Proteus sp. G2658]
MHIMLFRKRKIVSIFVSLSLFSPCFYLQAKEDKTDLGHIQISDNKEKDTQGYSQVYEKDVSNVYLGKELLERYQGISPADLLKSAIGVYSGEARNGGALDPNIRGIQGQGRIPVTVDGTEQAITVYRGYSGASNRNYIDSNLISSIYIEKGPSLTPDMKTGIGGGIAIKTLDIRDIVPIGDSFGINFKGDISNNSTRYKEVYLNMLGDYRNQPYFYHYGSRVIDPALEITPQKNKDWHFHDHSFRLGIGFEKEKFNLLFAYALREKGNYLAGKRNTKAYLETDNMKSIHSIDYKVRLTPYVPFIAHIYRPGNEVPNTSSRNRSFLVKGTLFPESTHRFSINYRYTDLLFGDIMPLRLEWARYEKNLVTQWPLATINQQTGILTYQYKPEDKQTDLLLRLWGNSTTGHTNTRGGEPRVSRQIDYDEKYLSKWDTKVDTRFIDTASLYQENNRYGIDLSSIFKLSPQFSLSFSSHYQFEKLDSDELELPAGFDFVTSGRAGQRHEINLALSTDWKPLSWLAITAGGKYHYYHLTDTFLNNKRRNNVKGYEKSPSIRGFILPYRRTLTADEYLLYKAYHRVDVETLPEELKNYRRYPEIDKKMRKFLQSKFVYPEYENLSPEIKEKIINHHKVKKTQVHMMHDDFLRDEQGNLNIESSQKRPMITEYTVILYDKNGELSKSKNMFLSGYADINEKVPDPITGKLVNKYEMGVTNPIPIYLDDDKDNFAPEPSYQHGAFSPLVSATVYANEILRFYGRYTEQLRLPNLFEDTSGFSGSKARYYGFKLKPERAKSTEFGVVFDLTDWLNVERHADIKINYFHTNIENVFDRDATWQIRQFEKQKLEGLEVQARFDNGFIFMDTALVYSHKNKVCDKNAFSHYDPFGFLGIKECMTGGYPGGFLRTSIQPKYSVNLHLGTRWLDNKLEVGSRWLYSSEVENKDEKWLKEKLPREMYGRNNNPMRWAKVFTVDAYINYQYSPNLSFEITGSNLLNEYYIDPLTRSGMPAPGRTFRLGVTAQF